MKLNLGGGMKRPQPGRPGVAKPAKPATVTDLFGGDDSDEEQGPLQQATKRPRADAPGGTG